MLKSFRRQNPLLAEMLISLLFFSVCACIIVCVFVSAFNTSETAASQQEALLYCQNIAEEFKADAGDFTTFFEEHGWSQTETGAEKQITFSSTEYNFTVVPIETGRYIDGFRITAQRDDKECFAFRVEVLTDE